MLGTTSPRATKSYSSEYSTAELGVRDRNDMTRLPVFDAELAVFLVLPSTATS